MEKIKPSDSFYTKQYDDTCEWMELDEAGLAKAFDTLAERVERLVHKTNLHEVQINDIQDLRNKPEAEPKKEPEVFVNGNKVPYVAPKQEPKCEHDGYCDKYWCGDRVYKLKSEYPTCPCCPTEKRESLRDVLMYAYTCANLPKPSYFENAKCFSDQAQAAKEHFARMIDEAHEEWSKQDANQPTVYSLYGILKKRLEKS